jgi:hypothetical protein
VGRLLPSSFRFLFLVLMMGEPLLRVEDFKLVRHIRELKNGFPSIESSRSLTIDEKLLLVSRGNMIEEGSIRLVGEGLLSESSCNIYGCTFNKRSDGSPNYIDISRIQEDVKIEVGATSFFKERDRRRFTLPVYTCGVHVGREWDLTIKWLVSFHNSRMLDPTARLYFAVQSRLWGDN